MEPRKQMQFRRSMGNVAFDIGLSASAQGGYKETASGTNCHRKVAASVGPHDVLFSFVAVSCSLWQGCWPAGISADQASAIVIAQQPERSELGDIDGHKPNNEKVLAKQAGQAGVAAYGPWKRERECRARDPLELLSECRRRQR